MAAPITAGTTVVPLAVVSTGNAQAGFFKVGVCESAVDGPPPTDVIVAWEDGTRETYAASAGLAQLAPPTTPSLLGSYGTYADGVPLPHPGARVAGVVIAQGIIADASGGSEVAYVFLDTPQGVFAFPETLFQARPAV